MINEEYANRIENLDFDNLKREDSFDKFFEKSVLQLQEVYAILMPAIKIGRVKQLPTGLERAFDHVMSVFLNQVDRILNVEEGETVNHIKEQNSVKSQIRAYNIGIFAQSDPKGSNVIAICNAVTQNFNPDYNLEIDNLHEVKQRYGEVTTDTVGLLEKLQAASAERVVQNYSKAFEDESNDLKFTSNIWLGAGLILSIIFLVGVFCANDFFPIQQETSNEININNLLTRVVMLSFNIFLIVTCFRQYNVHKHLSESYKYRMNSLNSYELFISSIDEKDSQTKHQIIAEVAKAIYTPIGTGFLNKSEGNGSPSSILEVTKLMNSSS